MNATDRQLIEKSDKKWFDELVLELRLRQVHGSAIGDTLASARELLGDTGQSAEETFGPVRDYAAQLELPAEPQHTWIRTALWPSLVSLLAFLLFTQAVTAWAQSEPLLVSPAQLALIATPVVLVAFLPLYLAAAIRRVWLLILLVLICALSGFFSGIVAPTNEADAWLAIDPLPWLIGSAVVMVALAIVNTVHSTRVGSADEITDPLSEAPTGTGWGSKLFAQVTNWLFPLFALGMLGLALLLG